MKLKQFYRNLQLSSYYNRVQTSNLMTITIQQSIISEFMIKRKQNDLFLKLYIIQVITLWVLILYIMKKIYYLLKPIPTSTFAEYPPVYQKSLIQMSQGLQAYIYLLISKFLITIFFFIGSLYQCELTESHSIATTLLLYYSFCVWHQFNYKQELDNTQKLNTILHQLHQQGLINDQQPDRQFIQQLITAIKGQIQILSPELHREYKYLNYFAQIIIIRFIYLLTNYPFHASFFRYFTEECDSTLLNVLLIMIFTLFLEFFIIYFFFFLLIIALPLLCCLQCFRKFKHYYGLYKLKRYFNSFPTHKFLGQEDTWINGDKTCCICIQDYIINDNLLQLPCQGNHQFHESCIRNWLQISIECPLCRQKLG